MHRSALFLALALAFTTQVQAANHREAPITALDQKADITDVYAFRSYDDGPTPKVTLIMGVDPFQEPANGQFDVSTEALSQGMFAAASAGAGFSGEFTGTGERVDFLIDFSNENELLSGLADAELFITLVSGGITLFDEVFSTTQWVEQSFILSAGSINLFDIPLISDAQAEGLGGIEASSSNIASAAFSLNAAPIPEPSMAWLMLGGLGLLGVVRRNTFRAAIQ